MLDEDNRKLFKIIPNGSDYVYEEDLEGSTCNCGGRLKITYTEESEYTKRKGHQLTCGTCNGHYSASELSKLEKIDILRAIEVK